MVYSIDYTHNGHMYPTQLMQIFSSASCVQQLIIPERLNQIYIVAHRWKEKILSFPTMCHSINLSPVSNLKGQATIIARHVSEKVRSESLSPISIDRSTQDPGLCLLLVEIGVVPYISHKHYG